ncbi:MAG TPA: ATP-binding protein [Thermoanaerobaculia bacterium]|nr:ATP-binding protein [Thermoanaerobaculia bacterium]
MTDDQLVDLLSSLVQQPSETEWVELKQDNINPEEIGRNISALSNSAILHDQERAFIVWGVEDGAHAVVGSSFRPRQAKFRSQGLENWLTTQLEPRVQFWIHEFEYSGRRCVIFEIEPAISRPVRFKGREWIRVGPHTKPLDEHPEKERVLWRLLSRESFESAVAKSPLTMAEVLLELDYEQVFRMTGQPVPDHDGAIVERLCAEKLVRGEGSRYGITNLGAVLFARDLRQFDALARKAIRVVFYQGGDRTSTPDELAGKRGYAVGFRGMVQYIVTRLPKSEEIRKALRVTVPMFPELAIRELLANALIHQDFAVRGAGPVVEVFADRMEITNPGAPLIDVERFLDMPPRSRNEKLAHLSRRLGLCEERGTGIDRVLTQIEAFQLPAPDFQVAGDNTRAILFAPRAFAKMTKQERVRACYQHAGLQWVCNAPMTNESLRKRLGIDERSYATASRVISDTIEAGLVRPFDPTSTSRRHAKYVPFWA